MYKLSVVGTTAALISLEKPSNNLTGEQHKPTPEEYAEQQFYAEQGIPMPVKKGENFEKGKLLQISAKPNKAGNSFPEPKSKRVRVQGRKKGGRMSV